MLAAWCGGLCALLDPQYAKPFERSQPRASVFAQGCYHGGMRRTRPTTLTEDARRALDDAYRQLEQAELQVVEARRHLGATIKRLREAGVAQVDMARHLGRNRELLRLWEQAAGR